MATRLQRSKTFAVLTENGGIMDVFYLHRITATSDSRVKAESYEPNKKLEWKHHRTPWPTSEYRDHLIETLTKAGLTVRYFDHEEKRWMDNSLETGLTPAPGPRDGQWGIPDLDTFERDYLRAA